MTITLNEWEIREIVKNHINNELKREISTLNVIIKYTEYSAGPIQIEINVNREEGGD